MLLLVLNIMNDRVDLRFANGKRAVSSLPGKFRHVSFILHPFGAALFDFLDQLGLGDRSTQNEQAMHVIGDAASLK